MCQYFAKRVRCAAIAALFVLLCIPAIAQAEEAAPVMVFAAASTTNAVNEIGTLFKEKGGTGITSSFASSSTLAKQIEQGAPASVFISADEDWMNYLSKLKLIAEDSRVNLLGNSLVLIAPASGAAQDKITVGKDLVTMVGSGRIAVGDPDHVPVGKYAKAALIKLNIWKDIEPKLARTSDVRGALTLVERGEAAYGIVYSTDAAITKKVRIVGQFPPDSYPPVVYPVALIAANVNPAARSFFDFLKGEEARKVFTKYGFVVK
jgi:molybdate transport system substrate-binding protein